MSQRAYARHRDVYVRAVQEAVQSGRISTLPDGQIDSDVADAEWERNTNARQTPVTSRRKHEDDEQDSFGAAQYSKARAVREHYQARLARLEYEEKVGNLVSKDEVKVAAFNKFRLFRESMLNIPDRLAAMLAAESEEARCYEILATEIGKALVAFAEAATQQYSSAGCITTARGNQYVSARVTSGPRINCS